MVWIIVLAVILLILILKISVRVRVDGELALTVGVGIFRIRIFPKKEKELRLSDYKIKKFRKNLEKQRKKELKEAEASQKKKQKKKKDDTAAKVEKARGKSEGDGEKRGILELIGTLGNVAKTFIARFGHHLRIKVRRLRITVATDNAASTAVMYGAVCGAVQCLLEFFDNTVHLILPKNAEVDVTPDFSGSKTAAQIDIAFSFRLWQLFDILIRTLISYIRQIK